MLYLNSCVCFSVKKKTNLKISFLPEHRHCANAANTNPCEPASWHQLTKDMGGLWTFYPFLLLRQTAFCPGHLTKTSSWVKAEAACGRCAFVSTIRDAQHQEGRTQQDVISQIFPLEMASSVWPVLVMRKNSLMSLPGLNELDNSCTAQAGDGLEHKSCFCKESKH